MGMLETLRAIFTNKRPKPLAEWFFVTFDETTVRMHATPPSGPAWSQEFAWDSVVRICFKAEDMLISDGIYVFTTQRKESYVIPTEASGGSELWGEIVRRGLFDTELAIEAAKSLGGLFCWPPPEQK